MRALNNVTTADGYTTPNTVQQPNTVRVSLDVAANGSCYVQLADDNSFGLLWTEWEELYKTPGHYILNRRCGGARVRSGATGVPTQVTLELLTRDDLPGG